MSLCDNGFDSTVITARLLAEPSLTLRSAIFGCRKAWVKVRVAGNGGVPEVKMLIRYHGSLKSHGYWFIVIQLHFMRGCL